MGLVKDWIASAPLYEPRDYPGDIVARLDLNEHPGPVPGFIIDAVLGEARNANRYPEKRLYDELYGLLEEYTGLDKGYIVFGPGSDSLLRSVFDAVIRPGDLVVYASPSFAMYSVYSALSGARVEIVQLNPCGDRWCLNLAEFIDKARRAKLVLIDNPNNPTGSLLVESNDVRELVEETEALILVDEAYYEFSRVSSVPLVEETQRVVVARTFSKAFGLAGMRIGYLVAPREIRDSVWKLLAPFPVPRTSIAAAIAALRHRDFFDGIVRSLIEAREWLRSELSIIGARPYRSWTNFVLVDTGISGVVDKLAARKIMVRRVPLGDTWARITIGAKDELDALITALRELGSENTR